MLNKEQQAWIEKADKNSQTRPYTPGETGYPPGAPRNVGQFDNPYVTKPLDGGFADQTLPAQEYFKQPATECYADRQARVPQQVSPATGSKYDAGKVPLDLLDPVALEGLAAVLQFGANKYAAHNWRGGLNYSRLLAALLRHIFAIQRGERIDPESGLPHIDHAGCCWMFLSNQMKTRPDMDDLHKGTNGQ